MPVVRRVRPLTPALSPEYRGEGEHHSILRLFARIRHLHDLRIEPRDDVDQIRLGRHHFVDVLVDDRRFVDPRGQKLHAGGFEDRLDVCPAKLLAGRGAAHQAAGAVEALCSDGSLPLPRTTKPGVAIEPGMTPSTPVAGRRRAFAVDDQLAAAVRFLPGEVVVVLDAGDHLRADRARRPCW